MAASSLFSPAASSLGMGDALKQQVNAAEEERKKKLLAQAQQIQGYGNAAQSLFGLGSAAGGFGV